MFVQYSRFFFFILCFGLLAACSSADNKVEAKYPTGADRSIQEDIYKNEPSIFGKTGMNLLGDDKEDDASSAIGVNAYLWRAALDTVSFMPLASADPFGGVILTDWYEAEDNPGERIKLNVFILDRQLKAEGLRVKVFKQIRRHGQWKDVETSEETTRQLEDAILTRAREMRVSKIGNIVE